MLGISDSAQTQQHFCKTTLRVIRRIWWRREGPLEHSFEYPLKRLHLHAFHYSQQYSTECSQERWLEHSRKYSRGYQFEFSPWSLQKRSLDYSHSYSQELFARALTGASILAFTSVFTRPFPQVFTKVCARPLTKVFTNFHTSITRAFTSTRALTRAFGKRVSRVFTKSLRTEPPICKTHIKEPLAS